MSGAGAAADAQAAARVADFEARLAPGDAAGAALLNEMRAELARLQAARAAEDPRLSFSTPEFKEAARAFTDAFKRNFGRPAEWALVKEFPWSAPQLRRVGGEGEGGAGGQRQ